MTSQVPPALAALLLPNPRLRNRHRQFDSLFKTPSSNIKLSIHRSSSSSLPSRPGSHHFSDEQRTDTTCHVTDVPEKVRPDGAWMHFPSISIRTTPIHSICISLIPRRSNGQLINCWCPMTTAAVVMSPPPALRSEQTLDSGTRDLSIHRHCVRRFQSWALLQGQC